MVRCPEISRARPAHQICGNQVRLMQALDDEEDVVIAEAVRFLTQVVASQQLRRRAMLRVVTKVLPAHQEDLG